MDLTSKKVIKALFKKYKIKPSKKLGQNFLIDKNVIRKFIHACNLKSEDIVLEIGPGTGILTQEIAKKTKKVVAIEKDQKMVRILNNELNGTKNVRIIPGDILKIPNSRFKLPNSYKLVGNLPFYLTAPVIRKFLESERSPQEMIFMVQKEVAQRICAKPRTRTSSVRSRSPKMSILAVSVQVYAQPEIISYVSKKSFWPQPKVDSSIIKIIPQKSSTPPGGVDLFFRVVKAGFSHPRKQLVNNLSTELEMGKEKVKNWLLENEIEPQQRAETLEVKDWINLTKTIK